MSFSHRSPPADTPCPVEARFRRTTSGQTSHGAPPHIGGASPSHFMFFPWPERPTNSPEPRLLRRRPPELSPTAQPWQPRLPQPMAHTVQQSPEIRLLLLSAGESSTSFASRRRYRASSKMVAGQQGAQREDEAEEELQKSVACQPHENHLCRLPFVDARFRPGTWSLAHATFYGDETASETMGGACGYGNLFTSGYGTATAALSTTLFNNGYACGTCYQVRCVGSPHCFRGSPFTTVTATNLCPPNWAEDSNNGGWCNPPRTHFDMSKPAFMKIAEWKAGIVPVMYRRVPCIKSDGVRFSFQGNGYWLLVYVMNVGGGGDIGGMWVKGSKTGWISMSHNWGASYQAFATLGGQSLSFKITSYTTKETIIAWDVAPSNWNVGLTYQASINFA